MSEMGNAMMGTGVASGEDRAEEAAEAAVASPLLEDIDLAGARGVLVNITAGMDMSIEEFETVGNHVKAYASDNATVVVGAVIDPEMSDELRVTVVATGIGAEKKPDIQLVSKPAPRPEPMPAPEVKIELPVEEAVPQAMGAGNVVQVAQPAAAAAPKSDLDYLDIPAFLRKQAD